MSDPTPEDLEKAREWLAWSDSGVRTVGDAPSLAAFRAEARRDGAEWERSYLISCPWCGERMEKRAVSIQMAHVIHCGDVARAEARFDTETAERERCRDGWARSEARVAELEAALRRVDGAIISLCVTAKARPRGGVGPPEWTPAQLVAGPAFADLENACREVRALLSHEPKVEKRGRSREEHER